MASTEGNPANFFQHPAPLGSNLYDRDRVKATPPEGRQLRAGSQPLASTKAAPEPSSAEKASMRCDCAGALPYCAVLCCAVLCCAVLRARNLCTAMSAAAPPPLPHPPPPFPLPHLIWAQLGA